MHKLFFLLCILVHKLRMVEKYLMNLSDQILKKMEEGNYTIARFAAECDVSEREISKIKNGESKSIKLDILVKICDSHCISFVDVFGLQEELERKAIDKIMKNFILTDGTSFYNIVPKE